jgi:hypothetical protein
MICEEFFELVFLTLPEKMLDYLETRQNEFFKKFAMTVKLETNNPRSGPCSLDGGMGENLSHFPGYLWFFT